MIYRHENWGDKKHYSISNNGMGTWKLREFVNRCKRTEITLNNDEYLSFREMLLNGGWKPDDLSNRRSYS